MEYDNYLEAVEITSEMKKAGKDPSFLSFCIKYLDDDILKYLRLWNDDRWNNNHIQDLNYILDKHVYLTKAMDYSRALREWLSIRLKNGQEYPTNVDQLLADIEHSALLPRILNGDKIYPEPPPGSWYDLIEKGKAKTISLKEYGKTLLIDQSIWNIIEKVKDGEWVASYEIIDAEALEKIAKDHERTLEDVLHEMQYALPKRLASTRWKISYLGKENISTIGQPYMADTWEICKLFLKIGE